MLDCKICKIAHGDIVHYTIHETDATLAVLEPTPRSKGHAVVFLKRHAATLQELSLDEVTAVFASVKMVVEKITATLKPDGFNIGWNNGKAAGQGTPHLHVHVMPRWHGDGGGNMFSIINNPSEESLTSLHTLINK